MKKGKIITVSVLLMLFSGLRSFPFPENLCSDVVSGKSYNVLIILIDALRADHLGCYGYHRETTPHIDQLSKTSVIFTNAISPSSWTKPSIPSLFTSLYPSRHGVLEGSSKDTRGHITSDILQDSLLTMAEVFKQNDYSTVAFIHNAQLRGFLGFSQGFDLYNDRAGDAEHINASFISWLETKPKAPFFGYLHFLDVHFPYQPPAPYDTIFGQYKSKIDFFSKEWKTLRKKINEGEIILDNDDLNKMICLYDGELRYVDDQLGILFGELEERNLYDNTLIIIIADHGEEFMEHGKIGHGQSLYNELLHIPLLIKFPGNAWGGTRIDQAAELIDLLPTLVHYLGWQPLPATDGHSLLNIITGEEAQETSNICTYSELYHRGVYKRTIMKGKYKLIETYSGTFRKTSHSPLLTGIHIGDRVEIEGEPAGNHYFSVEKIALDDNQADDDDEIEGVIGKIYDGGRRFTLMSLDVLPLPEVRVKGLDGETLSLSNLEEGMRVKLNGRVNDSNEMEVNRINLKASKGQKYTLEGVIKDLVDSGKDSLMISMMGHRIIITRESNIGGDGAPIRNADGNPVLSETELYDLVSDPGEKNNSSTAHPEKLKKLQSFLAEKFLSASDFANGRQPEALDLDEETVDELRAIGYVE